MAKLTDVQIRNWVRGGSSVARSDGGGLTFTLSARGTAAWVLRYRYGGRPRELTLGRYPDIGLAKARELAIAARAQIQQGKDVARDKQTHNAERAAARTFRELADSYMAIAFPGMAANTVQHRRRHIEKDLLPRLGTLAARDVKAADIVAAIEVIGKRSISVAELAFTAASEIFKHGIARHTVIANPCAGISVSAICGRRQPRTRLKLTEDELRVILPALPFIGHQNALATKILLATCTRINELVGARWEYVDLERAEWVVPHPKGRKDRAFTIPLCPAVVGWFSELRTYACGSAFVLPARTARRTTRLGGDAPMNQLALNAMLHKLCIKLGSKVRRFTPHDLRSTARSHLAALGVSVIVAERCLNHSLGGLMSIYDQHDYFDERRAALARWTELILACEAGEPQRESPTRPAPPAPVTDVDEARSRDFQSTGTTVHDG
jgi:integrase